MDIAIVDHGEGVRLLRNDMPHGNWIEFRLHSRVPGSKAPIGFGDGATVVAWTGKTPLRRTVSSSSYLSQDSRRVHVGLGGASKADRVEVQWLGGRAETWTNLAANHIYELTEGDPTARLFSPAGNPATPPPLAGPSLEQFWSKERAAMDAMRTAHDFPRAASLFREALALNPTHEDSLYYLANCLAAQGDIPGAVDQLETLARLNPRSHRALEREGELLAASATSRAALEQAIPPLDAAFRLNSEETGTLLLRGEADLGLGHDIPAAQTFAHVCQTNPHEAAAWFLRGYIAWKRGNNHEAEAMLAAAKQALGPDFKPAGAVSEGDVRQTMYGEAGFLNTFEQHWDGTPSPGPAYSGLDNYLRRLR